ncbi:MAG TPA: hypothetical protein VGU46_04820 [Acidobacteriaceae bacterium]|nr:hypothetical protein [Acidobacteriaceae bacterium]
MNFQSVLQVDVPKGRDGKHKQVIRQVLAELEKVEDGFALRMPIADLPDSKENIRAALSRVTRQRGMNVATSSDETYLYIWKSQP